MFKSRKTIIGALLLLALVVTSASFAFWASGVTEGTATETGTITVGTGDTVTSTVDVTAQVNADGNLVPVGYEGGTDINNLDLTFPVLWTTDAPAAADALVGTLVVTIDSVEIGGVDYTGLFTVTVSSGTGAITEDSSQNVVVNVLFANEPANSTEYAAVAGQSLIVTISFTVNAD